MPQESLLVKMLTTIKKCLTCGKMGTELVRGGNRIWVCENKDCSMRVDTRKIKNWKKI